MEGIFCLDPNCFENENIEISFKPLLGRNRIKYLIYFLHLENKCKRLKPLFDRENIINRKFTRWPRDFIRFQIEIQSFSSCEKKQNENKKIWGRPAAVGERIHRLAEDATR